MGFRDLQAFKLDMLIKQAWRLIHHSRALFFQIYKARYFPKCSFMKAEIGIILPMYGVYWQLGK